MVYALIAVIIVSNVFLFLQLRAKDKLIENLTNKLMARNYTDYVTGTRAREDPPPELSTRKPYSWYDDPNIPDVGGDSS
ncbi:hypothetical protein D3C76_262770 [compost metagenome]